MRLVAGLLLLLMLGTCVAGADTLFTDDFSDNATDGWTPLKGTWSAPAGILTGESSKKGDIVSGYSGCVSCTIEADVAIQTPGAHAILLGWYSSRSNLVEVRLMHNKQKLLLKHRGPDGTAAKKAVPFPINTNVTYHVAVSYQSGQFEVSVDGNTVITVATSALPSGTLALRVKSTTGALATATFDNITITGAGPSASVNDFLYQLQNNNLTQMGNSAFDVVIMDYSSDGSEDGRYTLAEISALKNSPGGPKTVLAYMSIGEAEDYRWYWQNSWDADHNGVPDAGAPAWLGLSNPDWEGNYKVKYWDPNWQSVVYGSSSSYLDKVLDAGFDGVYLDIIDAFEYWGPGGDSGLDRATAQQDMVDFVLGLTNYARVTKSVPGFLVFPQNGEALSAFPAYVDAVSGIGKEDTWYDGNSSQDNSYTQDVIAMLDIFLNAGKLVLVTDYVTQSALIDDFYAKALARGYVPYATVRDLDQLTINAGHEPD